MEEILLMVIKFTLSKFKRHLIGVKSKHLFMLSVTGGEWTLDLVIKEFNF